MTRIPGIFERPPGSGVHWISYSDADGHRHREKAGKFTAAVDLLHSRRAQVRKNEYIPPRQKRVWTFQRLAAETIRSKALRLEPTTIETDEYRMVKLLPIMGHVRCDRLTSGRIEDALANLKRGGLTSSTCNRYRSFISSVFSHAVKLGLIASNPCTRVARFKENDPRVRWLRPEEEARIRSSIDTPVHEWEFDLALYTAMRSGEQFGLKWKDCDLEKGNLTVKGKTGRRQVVANADAIEALKKLFTVSGQKEFVSPENDGKKLRDGRRWFKAATDAARVKDFHWHDLRHTFASRLVMLGEDIRAVQELLGHKNITQTMKYAHLSNDRRRAAAAKMKKETT
jgi:integrase